MSDPKNVNCKVGSENISMTTIWQNEQFIALAPVTTDARHQFVVVTMGVPLGAKTAIGLELAKAKMLAEVLIAAIAELELTGAN
jgi:hypothetical protein